MEFNVETFLSGEVSATDIEKLRKVELVQVAKHLSEEAQVEGLQKAQGKATVIQLLTEKELSKAVAKTCEMSQMEYELEMKCLGAQKRKEQRKKKKKDTHFQR